MQSKKVIKHVLSNGLTVLLDPSSVLPRVSVQLWYNVGSKDEQTGEKGIAHLIEHMIFKGTKKLSECDISLITHKLSGYTNAFTSYDYTGYLFDFPSQQWEPVLGILADCMHNATFKEGHLNSELKAVIQELKMYKDNYPSCLAESLIGALFPDHPYHHPIIGYKQDLWSLKRDALVNFYKKHYIPNNATLVIVGDIDPEKTIQLVEKEFGHLVPNYSYKKEEFYHSSDLQSKSVTLYRDIKVPSYVLAWEVLGAKARAAYLTEIVSWVVATGKGSRLYRKLANELKLITELEAFTYDLFDAGVFFIYFQPKEGASVQEIIDIIHHELKDIAQKGVSQKEITRAVKQVGSDFLDLLESFQKKAYALGKYYLATGDEQYLNELMETSDEGLADDVQDYVKSFLRSSLMHKGAIEPLEEEEKNYWIKLQEISDEEDQRILEGRTREEAVEDPCAVKEISIQTPKLFSFPRAQTTFLKNGLKVLYHTSDHLPKIDLVVNFLADHTYDPPGKEGLSSFVAALLLEGTKNLPGQQFSDTIESLGMSVQSLPGQIRISLLSEDFAKALEFLHEMVVNATMDTAAIEKVRARMLSTLKEFWDTPTQFIGELVRQDIYKNHPYHKNSLGTGEGVTAITREDILTYYTRYYSPRGTVCAIVGDGDRYDSIKMLEHMLASWRGEEVLPCDYPPIEPVSWHEIDHFILRDQTVLCYGALSVSRLDEDYDKLLLFDQIFTGGVLGSMASRLFDLREESGLFYTIGGSLLSSVDEQPGLMLIRTIVSNDRRKEAEVAIERVINTAIEVVSDEEFEEAQRAITNSLVDSFATNQRTAQTFLALDKYEFPPDYFDTRAQHLSSIDKETMQRVVKKYLTTDRFMLARAGRGKKQ